MDYRCQYCGRKLDTGLRCQVCDAKRSKNMALSKQEKKIFLEGLSCKNCTEKKRCKEQKNAKKKLLDYFFTTITEANCFDDRFIQEFKITIPSITRCDVVYERILKKLKEGNNGSAD